MKIQDFRGGLATRLRPQFLNINQGAMYKNIDSTVGTLAPLKGATESDLELDQYMFYFKEAGIWLSKAEPTSFVEYQNKVYYVNGSTTPKRVLSDGTEYNISIDPPSTASWSGAVVPGSGGLDGSYQYVLTFYNSLEGVESPPSPITSAFNVTAPGSVQFSNLPVSSDPQVNRKRLYRIGGNISVFSMVTELANTTVVYTDSLADTAIDGRILETNGNSVAPVTMQHISEYNGMLFGADGNLLRFTPVGLPYAWPILNNLSYPSEVRGSAAIPNGLIVLTANSVYLVTGTNPSNISSRLIDSIQGCVSWESIQPFGNTAIWVSRFGICASEGGEALVLSRENLGDLNLLPRSSTVIDRVYYLIDTTGFAFIMDARYSLTFIEADFNVSSLATDQINLYGWSSDGVFKLLSGDNLLSMSYRSPRFIEGSSSLLKAYKKIYFNCKGVLQLRVFIDDKLVIEKALDEKEKELQIPATKQRGYYIQFEIEGTGELLELEYVTERREQ